MRDGSLAGIGLRSDRQPDAILVQNNSSGPPAIWLHDRPAKTAWIITDVAPLAWCQLAYQFGHELGHVLANSWEQDGISPPPCRWLEEALVEAFSLRGLAVLAESWAANPPFPGDNNYARAIQQYRQDMVTKYQNLAREQGTTDLTSWYRQEKPRLDNENGLGALEQAAVPPNLGLIEPEPVLIEDYGGLNRWPERTGVALPEYLRKWHYSCLQIGAPGRLPVVLANLLSVPLG